MRLVEPSLEQILDFCAEDPVERVFLEDVARRSLGRFAGLAANGSLEALCHVGANVVPSGSGCGGFAGAAAAGPARVILGEGGAGSDLRGEARSGVPPPPDGRPRPARFVS